MKLFLEEEEGIATYEKSHSKRVKRNRHLFKLHSKSQNRFTSKKDVPKNSFEEKISKRRVPHKLLTTFVC